MANEGQLERVTRERQQLTEPQPVAPERFVRARRRCPRPRGNSVQHPLQRRYLGGYPVERERGDIYRETVWNGKPI